MQYLCGEVFAFNVYKNMIKRFQKLPLKQTQENNTLHSTWNVAVPCKTYIFCSDKHAELYILDCCVWCGNVQSNWTFDGERLTLHVNGACWRSQDAPCSALKVACTSPDHFKCQFTFFCLTLQGALLSSHGCLSRETAFTEKWFVLLQLLLALS